MHPHSMTNLAILFSFGVEFIFWSTWCRNLVFTYFQSPWAWVASGRSMGLDHFWRRWRATPSDEKETVSEPKKIRKKLFLTKKKKETVVVVRTTKRVTGRGQI